MNKPANEAMPLVLTCDAFALLLPALSATIDYFFFMLFSCPIVDDARPLFANEDDALNTLASPINTWLPFYGKTFIIISYALMQYCRLTSPIIILLVPPVPRPGGMRWSIAANVDTVLVAE